MRKTIKRIVVVLGGLLGTLVVVLGAAAAYVQVTGIPKYPIQPLELKVEITPQRVERGRKIARLSCINCHGDPSTHLLTGKKLDDAPEEFGVIYSRNITQHPQRGIGAWSDGDLARLLRTGLRPDGQYIPIYMPKMPNLSEEDLYSLIAFLRSDDPLVRPVDADPPGRTQPSFLVKALSHAVFKPLPYPSHTIQMPPVTDRVAHGKYLVHALDCYACHSADFKKLDVAHPERSAGYLGGGNQLLDLERRPIYSANLTFDTQTGIGRWSEGDFLRAMKQGIRPDRSVLRYPMMPMVDLRDDEVLAIYAYLKTVPVIRNEVPRAAPAAASAEDPGLRAYNKYGCSSCHGPNGVGIADLRDAARRFPTDDSLQGWIRNAPGVRPGTVMPTFDGVIEEQDYAPLIKHVRQLGSGAEQSRR
jgi:mono/diheme cytochrome c family protein